jgi:hypothetical protein
MWPLILRQHKNVTRSKDREGGATVLDCTFAPGKKPREVALIHKAANPGNI